jgi:hypothetical protein
MIISSTTGGAKNSIRFEQDDLELFRHASHDVNPLHTSAIYARRTAFGQPVVFGILGCLAAIGTSRNRPGEVLTEASAIFHGPIFLGIEYRVEVQEKDASQIRLVVRDSGRIIASINLKFRPGLTQGAPTSAACPLVEPRSLQTADLSVGTETIGDYAPDSVRLAELLSRWNLDGKGVTPLQTAALLWASYLVGMELPGERAVFSRFRLVFAPDGAIVPDNNSISYKAHVTDLDLRFNLLQVEADLTYGDQPLASAKISALVRDAPPSLSPSLLARLLPPGTDLEGKLALVTGGARGLGAAIVSALVSRGCRVLLNIGAARPTPRSFATRSERLIQESFWLQVMSATLAGVSNSEATALSRQPGSTFLF